MATSIAVGAIAASARHARGTLGCLCASLPCAAWLSGKRTGCTGIFANEKFSMLIPSLRPRGSAQTFSRGRAHRAFPGVPCAPWGCGARGGVQCPRDRRSAVGGQHRRTRISPPRPNMWPLRADCTALMVTRFNSTPAAPSRTRCGQPRRTRRADQVSNFDEFIGVQEMRCVLWNTNPQGRSAFLCPTSQSISIRETRNAKG